MKSALISDAYVRVNIEAPPSTPRASSMRAASSCGRTHLAAALSAQRVQNVFLRNHEVYLHRRGIAPRGDRQAEARELVRGKLAVFGGT